MYMNDLSHDLDLILPQKHTYIGRDGACHEETENILVEHLLDVYVNEQLTMKLICMPGYLPELVLGRLLTEGIIDSVDDVESVYICEYGSRARVVLRNQNTEITSVRRKNSTYVEETPSCCTGNHVLNDYFLTNAAVSPVQPISWKIDWIFHLADAFAQGMPIHSETWSTHSCFLAKGDEILFSCEDIGRHNALDKCIGFALREGIDPAECIIYSSGRIPTDMVMKAIRARIPVMASKAAPTVEAVALAKEFDLTLICAARRDRMKLMCGTKPVSN